MIFHSQPEGFVADITVVACYVLHNDKFILLQRLPDKIQGGKWGLPAGKVDQGERPVEAIVREVHEETGISVETAVLEKLAILWVENDGYQIEYHTFKTELSNPTPVKLSEKEHQDHCWVTPDVSVTMDLVHDLATCNKLFFNLE